MFTGDLAQFKKVRPMTQIRNDVHARFFGIAVAVNLVMHAVASAGLQSALTTALTGLAQSNANKAYVAPIAGAEPFSNRVAGPYLNYNLATERLSVVVPALVFDYGNSRLIDGRIFSIHDVILDTRLITPAVSDPETRIFYWPFGTLPLTEHLVASEFTTTGDAIVWRPPAMDSSISSCFLL
jgi:hypothetical protein